MEILILSMYPYIIYLFFSMIKSWELHKINIIIVQATLNILENDNYLNKPFE